MKKIIPLFVLSLMLLFLSGSIFAQTKNASYTTFKNWIPTEPDMQSSSAIEEIKEKLRKDDPYLWLNPVKVVTIDGKGYILNGHHRVKAATDIRWDGEVRYLDIPEKDISEHSGFNNAAEVVDAAESY